MTGHKALAVLRSFTADMREWGGTVSSEEKLMALAREYFVDERNTLDGLLLYIVWYGSGVNAKIYDRFSPFLMSAI
ncbi:hypothetical protein EIV52_22340 [Salmonella enterica]|nr:hypothetical protein [Salmonella enterica]